jgi:Ca2+-transporting ATPase
VIFTILIANAVVGIYQDYDADRAISALKDMQAFESNVLRNGKWGLIDSKYLVKGDIVELRTGDKVPADIRVIQLKTAIFKAD